MTRSIPLIGRDLLSMGFPLVEPYDFYRDIFGDGELDTHLDTEKLASISSGSSGHTGKYIGVLAYICTDAQGKTSTQRRSILDDLDEIDSAYHRPHDEYKLAITAPISYVGFSRKSSNARFLYALVIEIDNLIVKNGVNSGLETLKKQWDNHFIPKPTYVVASGSGVHLYYKFEKPVPLYKNVVKSLANYKKFLTRRLWNQYVTNSYEEHQIQFESLFQGFRVVGTRTKRGNGEVASAFSTGEPVSIAYLNEFAYNDADKIEEVYKSDLPLAQAKALYPEWYQRRVVEKKPRGHWVCNRSVYDWWLKRISFEAVVGHRYYCLMCLAIYAIKCDISYEELEKDCFSLMELYDVISPAENRFTEEDVMSALQIFEDKEFFTYPINSIVNRSGLQIEKNKRNGRKQAIHLERARAVQMIDYPQMEWINRKGRPKKSEVVRNWRLQNPDGKKADCIRETGLTKPTVYKWWDSAL